MRAHRLAFAGALAREELGGDALGLGFERRGDVVVHGELPAQEFIDASAQGRPVLGFGLEVSSQVEQGALTHLGGDAFGAHEAMGETGLAGGCGSGSGAPDEHGAHDSGG